MIFFSIIDFSLFAIANALNQANCISLLLPGNSKMHFEHGKKSLKCLYLNVYRLFYIVVNIAQAQKIKENATFTDVCYELHLHYTMVCKVVVPSIIIMENGGIITFYKNSYVITVIK